MNNIDLLLEKIRKRSLEPIHEYGEVLTNGHFAILKDYVPDTIREKLVSKVVRKKKETYENIMNKFFEARKNFKNRSVIRFAPSGIFKSSEEGEEIVCMFYGLKSANDLKFATYLKVYYEFVTAILGYHLYHDVHENHAYIVCIEHNEVAGLLMPVVPSCYLVNDIY
ncbi:hypothetical protein [Anaerocellum danielii]|uniref:Uncharacterized protein n=1 Tax=Anaerocellum danielii TaxID=1387557 RepID=A0ABZ0U1W4_9FIRM|nr:hypothetical protein [Caldicellulosiruptor danielii]WPX08190.1 hypothetical protein SOJ16_002056 [Caldicellulosiruptor danielii]